MAATLIGGEATSPAREAVSSPKVPPVIRKVEEAIEVFEAIEVKEFLDPPTAPIPQSEETLWARRMFEALLDPRSIQWVLTIGGSLMVLGLLVWLISLGIFRNPVVVAAVLTAGSLAVLGSGWLVVLKTKYKIAGQALTFLGCVILPLNLWFYHAQGLIALDSGLWVGSVVCCLLYAATVYVLRDPLFVCAVEAGVTLTVLLLMADLGVLGNPSSLSVVLMVLGLLSIHADRAFPPGESVFTRERFGMPLFWSGHAQIAASLLILLGAQIIGWLPEEIKGFLSGWGSELSQSRLLAGGLWLSAVYAYLYSDIVVRRVGVYTFLAAFALVMAPVSLIGFTLGGEGLIVVLVLTSLAASVAHHFTSISSEKIDRAIPPVALILGILPVLLGVILHLRATSQLVQYFYSDYATGWWFVVAVLMAAAANRVSAFLYRHRSPRLSAAFLFLSAASLLVAAAGLLRMLNLTRWDQQAPLLMLIPIGYLIAARLWRGHTPERPLGWVAHTATAVILVHVLFGSLEIVESVLRPVTGKTANLLLGLVFSEAAAFYALAAIFRRRSLNVYFAMAAACGAVWQLAGYWDVAGVYYTILYATLGVALLAVARWLGIEQIAVFHVGGSQVSARGRGLPAYQGGNAILLIAFLAAFFQATTRLLQELVSASSTGIQWLPITALSLTILANVAAIWLVLPGGWRRLYATFSVALAAVLFLTLSVNLAISPWQKLEIFCVVVGSVLVVAGYVGSFRESEHRPGDAASVGLWLGSALAAWPLLAAMICHRFIFSDPSLPDELALLTVTILMLVTGVSWQFKSTTLTGGSVLTLYLIILIVSLAYHPQVAVGVYLVVGGAVLFVLGIVLSVYREKILALPERIANREGVFRIMSWR